MTEPGFTAHPARPYLRATAIRPIERTPGPELVNGHRPPDVLQARAQYSYVGPYAGGGAAGLLSTEDALRAQRLAHDALERMGTPRIHVNRRLENVLELLRSDAPLSTIHDPRPHGHSNGSGYDLIKRQHTERVFNMTGHGSDAGRTVYGTVQFSSDAPRMLLDAHPPALGALGYGTASMVLKPSAWARTTILPRDSYGLDPELTYPGTIENIGDVVAERLMRSPSAMAAIQAEDGVELLMRQLVNQEGIAPDSMIEAAVRGVRRSDIAEIRIARARYRPEADTIIRRIRYHARSLGIPVHQFTLRMLPL